MVSSSTDKKDVPSPGHAGFTDYKASGVALKYVHLGYKLMCRHILTLLLVPVAALLVLELIKSHQSGAMQQLWMAARQTDLQFNLVTFAGCSLLLILVAAIYVGLQSRPVYLMDFGLYKPEGDSGKIPFDRFMRQSTMSGNFDEVAMSFQEKILQRSGLGDETYLPPALTSIPPCPSMQAAREEAEEVMFSTIDRLLKDNGLSPRQIDILVVNCSLFNPTPSLSAMIINHFKMRSNVVVYNLSGMGCSAGLIAIDLARQLLQILPSSRALVFSTENITQNWYYGKQRSMLIPNCLFRMGGAAVLLSNRRLDYWRSKYELKHVVRTHIGANDAAYTCVYQMEDDEGNVGVKLSKELMSIAGESLKANITTLGPLALPISEQVLFFINFVTRKLLKGKMKIKPYIPDFKLAFEHFCIHTGGRGVIEEIEKQLDLSPALVNPSKETLFRYGNTSSSSIWYILGNIESKTGVRRGDRVWQIAFGSGFKCNSAVWKATRSIKKTHRAWA
ncbi:hypothetical protein BSKO_05087 [Bryopsis sp. KO-2023]|nr:hypothetical protein BSKO_05087 [Bryopsis sp. KO-2023]